MNTIYLLLTVLLVGSSGAALVAINRYDAKKEAKNIETIILKLECLV